MRAIIITVVVLWPVFSFANKSILFHQGDYASAFDAAATEGKLVFMEFYASWCSPCQWMDKTTFQDEAVIDKLNADYIPVKVNIDDFDGFEMKERYGVNVLPTVIIFNEDGKVVDRVETTLSASKLSAILDQNHRDNGPKIHLNNQSPSALSLSSSNTNQITQGHSKTGPQLQLAVFSDYPRTLKYVNNVSPLVTNPLIVLHGYDGKNLTYRVMVSNLANREEAIQLKDQLKSRYGIDSFLKG